MKHYRQFQPLLISSFEATEWLHPIHRHNHYELIFIIYGTGMHQIGDQLICYKANDVFLIGPDDEHFFKIESVTRFVFIKFTDFYIHQQYTTPTYGLQQLEYLIKSRETHLSGFELSDNDSITVFNIISVVLSLKQDSLANEQLIWLQILAIATILQRNMPEIKMAPKRSRDIQALFCYIHKYIYQPPQLKSEIMAKQFGTTADYIGPYFKRNSGTTLREYISQYRKTLIKKRLQSGNYNLKQIAAEFGLTDESHVRKLIR
ncbi:AraC family transcriptional regulator [Pedobacter aquatilis]|uniref:AraC family transcriptional regulator n=1 Tax=Pedobacter aquatilis TaxID=351343 RepID=UPI002930FF02|nr:AraC family transcriptional regulator [Pedobacter aquatilis]